MNNKEQIERIEHKIKELQTEVDKLKVEDKNAFVKEFSSSELSPLSVKLFNNADVLQILYSAAPSDRPELIGKAFYINSGYKVELIKLHAGTAIAIFKE